MLECKKMAMLKVLMGLFILTMVFIAAPQQAQAYTLEVYNPNSEQLSFALVDYNDEYASWKVKGWYTVSPNSTRTLEFTSSTRGKFIYIYAYTSKYSWSGAAYNGSITRTVMGKSFGYYTPEEQCPEGPNRRTVSFRKWSLENDYLYWTPAEG